MNVDYEKRELVGSAAQLVAAADSRAVCAHRFLGLFLYRLPGQEQKMAEIRSYLFYYFSNCFCAAEHTRRVYRAAFMGISIIHGLKVRAAYLIQLDVFKQNVEARAYEAVRHEAEAKFGGKPAHRIDLTKQR